MAKFNPFKKKEIETNNQVRKTFNYKIGDITLDSHIESRH